jgi:hypothetical protein
MAAGGYAWAQGPSWTNPGTYVGSLLRETADERDLRLRCEREEAERRCRAEQRERVCVVVV